MSFAAFALDRFNPLLVELLRAEAPPSRLRAEGFAPREIAAAQELIFQVDAQERLDGHAAHDSAACAATGAQSRQDATADPVTEPRRT